jgi:hypothetical protein
MSRYTCRYEYANYRYFPRPARAPGLKGLLPLRFHHLLPAPQLNYSRSKIGAIIAKCNCTICLKTGSALVVPEEGFFKLLTPNKEMDTLTEYKFNTNRTYYCFCPKGSVRCFLSDIFEVKGQGMEILRINISTLDERGDHYRSSRISK